MKNSFKKLILNESSEPYYVTIYEESNAFGPEEGGYVTYGWEATSSKRFNSEEQAQLYQQEFIEGADIIETKPDCVHIRDEWDDEYLVAVESASKRGHLNSPARNWAEMELDIPQKGPWFDDTGKRVYEDPKVTAERAQKKVQLGKEYEAALKSVTTKNELIQVLLDRKYDSVRDDYRELAGDVTKKIYPDSQISEQLKEALGQDYSYIPTIDSLDYMQPHRNGDMTPYLDTKKFKSALDAVGEDAFKIRSSRLRGVSEADLKDEFGGNDMQPWNFFKDFDSSADGFNEFYFFFKGNFPKKELKEANGPVDRTSFDWNDEDEQDYYFEDEHWKDMMADAVIPGNKFFSEGKDWTWKQSVAGPLHIDFDNWEAWEAISEEGETGYFVVDVDTEFIDWGPVDTEKEAIEFLYSKSDDEDYEDDYFKLEESKQMRISRKRRSLNEDALEYAKKATTTVDLDMQAALDYTETAHKNIETVMKDKHKEVDQFLKDSEENKLQKNAGRKKLHLDENLFEDSSQYTLVYRNEAGSTCGRDYFSNAKEAVDWLTKISKIYKEESEHNDNKVALLEVENDRGIIIASACADDDWEVTHVGQILDEKAVRMPKGKSFKVKNVTKKQATDAINDKMKGASAAERTKILKELADKIPEEDVKAATEDIKKSLKDKGLTEQDKEILKKKTKIDPKIIDGADSFFTLIDNLMDAGCGIIFIIGLIWDIVPLITPGEAIPGYGIVDAIISYIPEGVVLAGVADFAIQLVKKGGYWVKDTAINSISKLPDKNTDSEINEDVAVMEPPKTRKPRKTTIFDSYWDEIYTRLARTTSDPASVPYKGIYDYDTEMGIPTSAFERPGYDGITIKVDPDKNSLDYARDIAQEYELFYIEKKDKNLRTGKVYDMMIIYIPEDEPAPHHAPPERSSSGRRGRRKVAVGEDMENKSIKSLAEGSKYNAAEEEVFWKLAKEKMTPEAYKELCKTHGKDCEECLQESITVIDTNLETYIPSNEYARDFLDRMRNEGKIKQVDEYINIHYPDGILEKDLDMLLAYENDAITSWIETSPEPYDGRVSGIK